MAISAHHRSTMPHATSAAGARRMGARFSYSLLGAGLFALFAGCGGSSDHVLNGDGGDPANVESGTRLRAQRVDLGGGKTRLLGWIDNKTNSLCNWGRTADNKYRCLPRAISTDVYFADSSCTSQL